MRVMAGCDRVVHLAAIPNPLVASEWEVLRVNTMSNWAVLEAAEKHEIGNIVMSSNINAIRPGADRVAEREHGAGLLEGGVGYGLHLPEVRRGEVSLLEQLI